VQQAVLQLGKRSRKISPLTISSSDIAVRSPAVRDLQRLAVEERKRQDQEKTVVQLSHYRFS
jgi:hypothetical protein